MKRILILGVNGFIGHHLSQAHPRRHRLAGVRHGHAVRARRGRCSAIRASTSSRATSPSTRSGSSTTSASATWSCRWWRSRRRPPTCASRCGCSSSTSRPTCRSSAQCVKHGKRVRLPVDLRGLRHVPRRGIRSGRPRSWCYGPIDKQRWIYACSKQLMDRVIWAYGSRGQLDFTLFRPFNWIGAGPRQHAHARRKAARA